jgi:hypothetical protein
MGRLLDDYDLYDASPPPGDAPRAFITNGAGADYSPQNLPPVRLGGGSRTAHLEAAGEVAAPGDAKERQRPGPKRAGPQPQNDDGSW